LFQHEAVADCAVIGKPDTESGEIPKALVLLHPGLRIEAEVLMDFVGGRLAGYKRVREVEFVTTIPKTASGKVLRRVLIEAEREKAKAQLAADSAAEMTASEAVPVETVASDEVPAGEMPSGETMGVVAAAPMPEHDATAWAETAAVPEPPPEEVVAEQHPEAVAAFLDEAPASTAPGEQETPPSVTEAEAPQETPSSTGPEDAIVAAEGSETEADGPSDEADANKASASTELAEPSPETAPSEPAAS
jgi:hypothetical protein